MRRDSTGLDLRLRPIERATRDYATELAVSDEVFDAYRRMYSCDPLPLPAPGCTSLGSTDTAGTPLIPET
jgi:hypothetical protein